MSKHRLFRTEYFVGRCQASHTAAIYNEELEQFAWPGGSIILYIDAEGSTLCAPCAMRTFPTPTATAYHEGPLLHCDQCGCELDSDYGDPDEEDHHAE